jgi:predicted RNA-binding Zn-ribbon protein involved in translation (DUF1610 family)
MVKKQHNKAPRCGTCGYPLSNNSGVKYVMRITNGRKSMESYPCPDEKCLYKKDQMKKVS